MKRHEQTAFHLRRFNALKNQPKVTNEDENRDFIKLNTQIKTAEIKIVLFLLQLNLPFLIIDHLICLIKSVASDSKIAKGLSCGRTKAAYTTSDVLRKEAMIQMSEVLRFNKFSIIIDETTDVATFKCLAVVARYFDRNIGKVRDRFVTLIELTQFDAKSMFETLTVFFRKIDVPLTNIIGIATDNGIKAEYVPFSSR